MCVCVCVAGGGSGSGFASGTLWMYFQVKLYTEDTPTMGNSSIGMRGTMCVIKPIIIFKPTVFNTQNPPQHPPSSDRHKLLPQCHFVLKKYSRSVSLAGRECVGVCV